MPHDELPEDLRALFRDAKGELDSLERRGDVPPAGAADRVWNKLQTRLQPPSPPAASPWTPVRLAALGGFTAGVLVGSAATLVAIGSGSEPPSDSMRTAAQVATVRPAAGDLFAEATRAMPAATVLPSSPRSAASPAPSRAVLHAPEATPSMVSEHDMERALLDGAAAALQRGDVEAAQRLLGKAKGLFPAGGGSVEEREALELHVVIAQRDPTAWAMFETFIVRHPDSIHRRSLEKALRDAGISP